MKKLICFLLAIVMTVSLAIPVFSEESEEPQYGTIKVEYSDARGTIENLDVMVLNGYVYAHMASFCERLGYRWAQKDGLVTIDVVAGIWYDEAPALALHFRPGDTTVSYNPLCGIEIEYDAPTPFIENDRGIWVPLQYTLTLLGGSRNIVEDILVIQMPTANVLSVAAMIMNSGGVLSFDWVDDFGYSETATNVTDGAARVVTLFEGLLSFDGSAWTSFVDWNAFDKKFGKTLAALMCTYSSDELKESIEEVEVMLDVFADDGALGSMLRTQEALIDSDVNAWEKICEEKLAQLKAGCGTLPQYNMAYQQYERATKKQDLFSAVGADEIISIQDGLAEATNALEWAKRIGYGVTYMAEFQQRDDFQATVLENYFANRKDTDKLDDATAKAIADYASSNIIEYTASKFFEEHALEILVDESGLDALMGVPANLLLLAWDIMSETIPFYSEGLESVENREISNYAQQVQNDAYQNLNTLIVSLRADTASISPEDCVQLAEYCYVYLKSCYIARSFAIESLEGISEETYKKLESKINVETDVNHRIVKYLSILGQADWENSCLILGFLPKNNRELLEIYSDADLVAIVQPYPRIDYENLVTDAYRYVYQDKYGRDNCYHIPQVNLKSCASVNAEINRTLMNIIDQNVHKPIRENEMPFIWRMLYVWGHESSVVSILVEAADNFTEHADYFPYYLSLETGAQIDKAELLAAFGLSEQDFYDQVYMMIKAYWDDLDENTKTHCEQMVEESLSNENIHAAVPFIHSNGKLSYVATIFVPAGGGIYQDIYDFETNEPLSYFVCSADHSEEPSATTEENNTDSSVSAQTPVQAFEAYSTVLDMFYSSIACSWTNCDGDGWGIANDPDDACYMFPHYLSDYSLNEIGFAFIDLNCDGTLELVIAPMVLTDKGEFYDLYTVSNGKVIHSASAGERDRFFLAVDGSINNHASGGAVTNVTSNKYLDPKDGQLKVNQAVIYDEYIDQESPWFHSTEEYYDNKVYDYYYDSLKPVSEEEAIHIKDAFPGSAALELSAFEEYGT